jgi:AraC-like DNA-binding protein
MILEAWDSQITASAQATILPDGCQDLLFTAFPGAAPRWEITSLDSAAYTVEMPTGTYFKGFRMRAGVGFSSDALLQSVRALPPDHAGIEDRLLAFTTLDPLIEDALEALAEQTGPDGNVALAAASIGVHQRKLQRAMARHTGRSAAKWLGLARVRRASRALTSGGALAEVAYDTGFSDQSHMTRAFRQWLGTTPKNTPDLVVGYN